MRTKVTKRSDFWEVDRFAGLANLSAWSIFCPRAWRGLSRLRLSVLVWFEHRLCSSCCAALCPGAVVGRRFRMDDYMKEMMDLKTLVTKTLEKKGVLARIRAELRANVFQAIEEQDHVSESEGGESFALLGQCSERAKQLHATPAGKLLTGLLCEYLEWCELDRTLKVYLPELNQPSPYSRSELEELLEIKTEKNFGGVSSEARPLLLEVLEGYLKSETTFVKDSYAVSSSNFPKSSRTSSSVGSKPLANGSDIADDDLRGVLESRLTLSK